MEPDLELFKRVLDVSNESVSIVDLDEPDRPLIYVNKQFEKVTGYSRDECIGRNCRFLQGEQTNQKTVDDIRAALGNNVPIRVDILNYRKNGEPFWNRLSLFPLNGSDGRRMYSGFQMNVTPEVVAKESVMRSAADLNKELMLTRDTMTLVAHDIKSDMSGLIGCIEMIKEDLDFLGKEEILHYLQLMTKQNNHVVEIVSGLLGFARLRGGTFTPLLTIFPADLVVQGEIESFSPALIDKKIALNSDLSPAQVRCDKDQFASIFRNIFSNAIKFTPNGGTIELSLAIESDRLKLKIVDSGPGLSEEKLEQSY